MTSLNLKAANSEGYFNTAIYYSAEPCPVQLHEPQASDVMQPGFIPSGYVPHLGVTSQKIIT